jgi:hypothetical protein
MSKRFIYYGSFASVQFFSDLFGMPAAAYSLRKLTPNATNCIRVRRSSDNTEQDIGFVANVPNSPIDTAALLAFVGAGNGFVTAWYDQSTNGRNTTQSTAARQPLIVSSGVVNLVNTAPSVLFNNANLNRLISNFTAIPQPISYFTTFRLNSWSGTVAPTIFDSYSNTQFALYNSGTAEGLPVSANNTFIFTSGTNVRNQRELFPTDFNQNFINGIVNGASSSYFNDNTSLLSGVNSGPNSLVGISIGALRGIPNPLSANYHMNGNIQEIIIYAANKTSERTDMVNNQTNYY